jgi:hypothetical protein
MHQVAERLLRKTSGMALALEFEGHDQVEQHPTSE